MVKNIKSDEVEDLDVERVEVLIEERVRSLKYNETLLFEKAGINRKFSKVLRGNK